MNKKALLLGCVVMMCGAAASAMENGLAKKIIRWLCEITQPKRMDKDWTSEEISQMVYRTRFDGHDHVSIKFDYEKLPHFMRNLTIDCHRRSPCEASCFFNGAYPTDSTDSKKFLDAALAFAASKRNKVLDSSSASGERQGKRVDKDWTNEEIRKMVYETYFDGRGYVSIDFDPTKLPHCFEFLTIDCHSGSPCKIENQDEGICAAGGEKFLRAALAFATSEKDKITGDFSADSDDCVA